ncbi:MAG: Sb-PDE family phosphodiesterase [Bacteroidota bacterium]
MKNKLIIFVLILFNGVVIIQSQEIRRDFRIPDIMGYHTMKGDFHMHTVFSDGKVWPDIRVIEAWQEGLDAIAITEHVEYLNELLPHDQNMSYEIAKKEGDKRGIIVIRGAEITRTLPEECGHMNALFLNDVTPLEQKDYLDAINEASNQGAFIFWNHPGWYGHQADTTIWFDVFTQLVNENKMHGIEVANWNRWFPEAFTWCIDKNLTVLANSDIHNPTSFKYDYCKGDHRPVTILFTTERTEEGMKDALFNRRTVAYLKRGFYNQLMGKEEYLKALFFASVEFELLSNTENSLSFRIKNISDLDFLLTKSNPDSRLNYRKQQFLYGRSEESITISKTQPVKDDEIKIVYVIENLLKAPDRPVTIEIPVNKIVN